MPTALYKALFNTQRLQTTQMDIGMSQLSINAKQTNFSVLLVYVINGNAKYVDTRRLLCTVELKERTHTEIQSARSQ